MPFVTDDAFLYTLTPPTPAPVTTTVSRWPKTGGLIEIWNPAETQILSTLHTDHDDSDLKPYDLDWMKNEKGDGTLTFKLKRAPKIYYPDLADTNVVKLKHFSGRSWCGDIEGVVRDIEDESILTVACLGWPARMKQNGSEADVAFDCVNEKASTYITDHILTDTKLGFTAGTIDTNDLLFTYLDFMPGKCWWDIMDEFCRYQLYCWYVDNEKRLHFIPRPTAPAYQAFISDCDKSSLNRTREKVKNWAQVKYTSDGTTYDYKTAEDTASQALHGMRREYLEISGERSPTEAQGYVDTFIALKSKLKPSSSLTTDRVYDMQRNLVPFDEAQGGRIITLPDFLSAEEANPQTINELCTWPLAEIRYKDNRLSLSPGDLPTTLDTILAGYELRDKVLNF